MTRPFDTVDAAPLSAATLADVLDVARSASGTGVVDPSGELRRWEDVAAEADRVALVLADGGARRGDRVAILLPKSVESFIAMHAALRAGLVAVPLNPLAPKRVLAPTLAATDPAVLVTNPDLIRRSIDDSVDLSRVVALVVGDEAAGPFPGFARTRPWGASVRPDQRASEALPVRPAPDDDAYILFTSGSTGEPKGMVHTHRSGLAYAREAVRVHGLDGTARLAGTAPLHFDMSTLELYSVPLAGGTALTITESDERFPATLSERLEVTDATHLYAVPSLLHLLIERGALDERDLGRLRHVAFAGEPMGAALLAAWMDRFPDVEYVNAYGPAEVNVVTSHRFAPDWDRGEVPIGRPWPDVRVRLLDDDETEVEADGEGELVVSAPSCMRGYWMREDETATGITTDDAGARWYRTGDVVRRRGDLLYFAGRRDNQVKVRGVRIEIEAIEHVVCGEPSVAQALATVVDDADGVGSIRVWAVPAPGSVIEARRVIRWCRGRLPAVAVPTEVIGVHALPVTANGKLDRVAVASWSADAG